MSLVLPLIMTYDLWGMPIEVSSHLLSGCGLARAQASDRGGYDDLQREVGETNSTSFFGAKSPMLPINRFSKSYKFGVDKQINGVSQ